MNRLPASHQTIWPHWCLTASHSLSARRKGFQWVPSTDPAEFSSTAAFFAHYNWKDRHPLRHSSCSIIQPYLGTHEDLWEQYPATEDRSGSHQRGHLWSNCAHVAAQLPPQGLLVVLQCSPSRVFFVIATVVLSCPSYQDVCTRVRSSSCFECPSTNI